MDIKLSGASKNCTCLRESIKKSCDDGDDDMNFRVLQAVTTDKERRTILVLCVQLQTTKTENVLQI